MMAQKKPTIVFVPGAWHGPEYMAQVIGLLQQAGWPCMGVALPTVGANPALLTIEEDVKAVRRAIEASIAQDQDVVLFAHSYGGVVASEAVKGLLKKDTKGAGVVHIFFCAAFVIPVGKSLKELAGDTEPAFWDKQKEHENILLVHNPAEIFYNDLEPEVAHQYTLSLRPFSFLALSHKLEYAGYVDVESNTYLFCEKDNAVPLAIQQQMVDAARAAGAKFRTESMDASHSPFLSRPKEVAEAIQRAAGFAYK